MACCRIITGAPCAPIRFGVAPSPAGPCLVGADEEAVCFVGFPKELSLPRLWPGVPVLEDPVLARTLVTQLFSNDAARFTVKLQGTPFQLAVWQALGHIQRGQTVSYSVVAEMIGHPNAVRAVGGAIGKNPVALLIPCHRVLPKSGGFGHYRWGTHVKQTLLALEMPR